MRRIGLVLPVVCDEKILGTMQNTLWVKECIWLRDHWLYRECWLIDKKKNKKLNLVCKQGIVQMVMTGQQYVRTLFPGFWSVSGNRKCLEASQTDAGCHWYCRAVCEPARAVEKRRLRGEGQLPRALTWPQTHKQHKSHSVHLIARRLQPRGSCSRTARRKLTFPAGDFRAAEWIWWGEMKVKDT